MPPYFYTIISKFSALTVKHMHSWYDSALAKHLQVYDSKL